ncbi:hypothetical protein [Thalassotalea euphylliae]|uniref:TMhelix containing protein n=1 Tax=Thalassotalea euphylliae TaxID=1655234 RepID=A0A3E0U4G5_9GAMM|nr:hypothetical protein [Thalassotalea euphylliae]REL31085.1 hypothetical protein DXX94_10365 [Thalassotalea euphylliae]
MTDFAKTVVAILVSVALSSAGTISALTTKIDNVDNSVTEIKSQITAYDGRLKAVEIKQAVNEALRQVKGEK